MRDITNIKSIEEQRLAKKCCGLDSISLCSKGDNCSCKIAAEILAYLKTIIPSPYYKYTIHDFTGDNGKDKLLETDVAIRAKKQIIDYCWENVDAVKIVDILLTELEQHSCISKRRKNGNNIVIFDNSSLSQKNKQNPKGKTMCAALIMKEAIKSREYIDGTPRSEKLCQTYEWVEYPILENLISKKEDIKVSDLKSVDWLVIDDITYSEQRWKKQMLDFFFLERLEEGLPTILVLKFDIAKYSSEDCLGVGLSKIIRDPKTFFISLIS